MEDGEIKDFPLPTSHFPLPTSYFLLPNQDTPIVAHALGDTKLRARPVDGIKDLSAILGSKAVNALRGLLLRSELFRVIVKDVELVEGRQLLTLLDKFPADLSAEQRGKLAEAIAVQALTTTVKGLEAARLEQARMYTQEKQMKALAAFAKAAKDLIQVVTKPGHFFATLSSSAADRLLAKLMKLQPKLPVTSASDKAAAAGKDASKAPSKRGKAEAASGNSPANSKSANRTSDTAPVKPLVNPALAALHSSRSSSSEGSISPALTPLAAGQLESNTSKLAELSGSLAQKELQIVQLQAELAEEKRTTSRLSGELTSTVDQLNKITGKAASLEAEVSGLKAQISTKDDAIRDLRHSQAMWSSMFMAQGTVDPSKFKTFMGTMTGESSK